MSSLIIVVLFFCLVVALPSTWLVYRALRDGNALNPRMDHPESKEFSDIENVERKYLRQITLNICWGA